MLKQKELLWNCFGTDFLYFWIIPLWFFFFLTATAPTHSTDLNGGAEWSNWQPSHNQTSTAEKQPFSLNLFFLPQVVLMTNNCTMECRKSGDKGSMHSLTLAIYGDVRFALKPHCRGELVWREWWREEIPTPARNQPQIKCLTSLSRFTHFLH